MNGRAVNGSSRSNPTRAGASAHSTHLHRRARNASWTVLAGSEFVIAPEVVLRKRLRREQIGAVQHGVRVFLKHVASLHLYVKRFPKRSQVFGETQEAELLDCRRRLRLIGAQKPGNKRGLAELDEGQPRR